MFVDHGQQVGVSFWGTFVGQIWTDDLLTDGPFLMVHVAPLKFHEIPFVFDFPNSTSCQLCDISGGVCNPILSELSPRLSLAGPLPSSRSEAPGVWGSVKEPTHSSHTGYKGTKPFLK